MPNPMEGKMDFDVAQEIEKTVIEYLNDAVEPADPDVCAHFRAQAICHALIGINYQLSAIRETLEGALKRQ